MLQAELTSSDAQVLVHIWVHINLGLTCHIQWVVQEPQKMFETIQCVIRLIYDYVVELVVNTYCIA